MGGGNEEENDFYLNLSKQKKEESCQSYSGDCFTCVENGCGYCSNDRNCTTQNSTSCPEHTWTNCCPTIASCKQCTKQSDCGYCKDFGCKEGSSAGANGFQCKNWTFDGLKCDEYDPSGFDATLVVIISGIVVGALVIIAVGVLI